MRKSSFPIKQYYRIDEVARYFDVSWRTVYRWIEKDMLRAYKIGGSLRIKRWDLKRFEKRAGYCGFTFAIFPLIHALESPYSKAFPFKEQIYNL